MGKTQSLRHSVPCRAAATLFALVSQVPGSAAIAQGSGEYPSVVSASAGNSWRVFYAAADLLTADTRAIVPHRLDLSYGDDPRQKLDLYLPSSPRPNAPVLIYVHGGNFIEGDRSHYGYVAREYARQGIVTIVPSYRLTSQGHSFPAQIDDLKDVLRWAGANIAGYGGSPHDIVIAGHSVGALMAADVGLDTRWMADHADPGFAINGLVLISGRFRPDAGPVGDAYAPTTALRGAASPIDRIFDPVGRIVIAYGSNEQARAEASAELARVLTKIRPDSAMQPCVIELRGANHADTAMEVALADSTLFAAVLALFAEPAEAGQPCPHRSGR